MVISCEFFKLFSTRQFIIVFYSGEKIGEAQGKIINFGLIIMHLLKLMCLLVAVFSHYYRERTDKTIFGASSKYSLCAKNKKKKAKNTKTV